MKKTLTSMVAALVLAPSAAASEPMDVETARMIVDLDEQAQSINRGLPVELDEITTLFEVQAGPGLTLHYHYELADVPASAMSTFAGIQKGLLEDQLCSESEVLADFEAGVDYVYHYYIDDEPTTIRVGLDNC